MSDIADAITVTPAEPGGVIQVSVDLSRALVLLKQNGAFNPEQPWDDERTGLRQLLTNEIHKRLEQRPMSINWTGGKFKGPLVGSFVPTGK